ncbi:hypothetical protein Slala03_82210 [Streptomyces lavendulae subsp. lavendulae]|uniref:hypothetical protein n=1 Tax=Streptomyces lavendulae TaxID=1914 RepID=UPI0024A2DAE7|nr:hypothetical protein [Streptomyces lavendulae]GLV88532.1 hypothetical protein Slala03_82210 [Streptomyces lavendulae subsp. lavendulae]
MVFLRCEAVRWVGDEPQPGLVEVRFTDAHQQQWAFIDKWPIFTAGDDLAPGSHYPVEVGILCDVLNTGNTADTSGTFRISVAPWGLESPEGRIEFDVRADQLTTS